LTENIYQLIKNLAEREEITEKEVIDMLILAIQDIYNQKNFTTSEELQIIFDLKKKQFMTYRVIKHPKDLEKEEPSAKNSKKDLFQEESLLQPLNLKEIGNYEEILQHFCLFLQKSRQKKLTEELLPLQGKIVEGTIQGIYNSYCLVGLLSGKALGY